MNDRLFLSQEELAELTGYSLAAWQRKWLDAHGYRYEKSAIGRPIVLKAYVTAKLSGGEPVAGAKMNLDALRKRA